MEVWDEIGKLAEAGQMMTTRQISLVHLANTSTADDQHNHTVTALTGGGWVLTGESSRQDDATQGSLKSGVYQQAFDPNGNPVGKEQLVNVRTRHDHLDQKIEAMPDGGWIIASLL